MNKIRKVEIFSAGCGVCDETVQLVNQIACESCEVEVLDMHHDDIARHAKDYGIKKIPSVVIDGKIADCCESRNVSEESLRSEGLGVPLP